ncbi:glycosyltransferase family protein [Enterovibrio coralii]|uniref:Glycosyltransferase subfamily 4-like N-terminal domain-containing protein n=1 Tax=Enterovibrio coralii TaxID=294935 RepID=A0A135I4Q8_9GAMM|nr:hypothetical protein [Enterovibrio coralii]KXF80439.1 hypothetical protein ATN88_22050 [Enterovibrio coralii]
MSAVSSTHICHIVSTYTDDVLNRQLLSNLSCSMSKDYEHTLVVLSKHQGQRLTLPNGVSCIELKNTKPLCWRSFRECKKILSILKPDICHTYGEVPLAMQWLAHRASISVKLHQLAPAQTEKDASWLSRLYLSALSHSTDVFISSSSDTYVWLKKRVKIAPEQCRLIRPAINARRFRPALQQVDAERTNSFIGTVAIPTNKFVVGTDITHHAIEDVIHLIDEFAVACKLSPEFKHNSVLLIAGNARFLPLLRNEIQARNIIENNVRFAGEISDYYPFFNVIDALAIPTEIDTRSALLLELWRWQHP